jgi:hypothetical protein
MAGTAETGMVGTTVTGIGIVTAEPAMTMTITTITTTTATHLTTIHTPTSVSILMTIIIIATTTGTRRNTTWDTEVTGQPRQAAQDHRRAGLGLFWLFHGLVNEGGKGKELRG